MFREIFMDIYIYIKLILFKSKWRRCNKKNYTVARTFFSIDDVKVGDFTYGELNIITHNKGSKLYIGKFCSIAKNVQFILCGEHDYKNISTYPFKAKFLKEKEAFSKGNIIVDDDVWIGHGCIIMSGIQIGKGAVIASGSVVTKNVPPYAIYAGKEIIKYRFSDEIINQLLKIDFGRMNKDFIIKNIELFYTNLDEEVLKQIESKIKQELTLCK